MTTTLTLENEQAHRFHRSPVVQKALFNFGQVRIYYCRFKKKCYVHEWYAKIATDKKCKRRKV